jgi:hypothetical protein
MFASRRHVRCAATVVEAKLSSRPVCRRVTAGLRSNLTGLNGPPARVTALFCSGPGPAGGCQRAGNRPAKEPSAAVRLVVGGAAPLVSRTHSHMYTCWSLAILTAPIRRLKLVTHQCSALRRRDLYVYLRLHRLQPMTNCNCSQPVERPANHPRDQIPERAGPEAGEQK